MTPVANTSPAKTKGLEHISLSNSLHPCELQSTTPLSLDFIVLFLAGSQQLQPKFDDWTGGPIFWGSFHEKSQSEFDDLFSPFTNRQKKANTPRSSLLFKIIHFAPQGRVLFSQSNAGLPTKPLNVGPPGLMVSAPASSSF